MNKQLLFLVLAVSLKSIAMETSPLMDSIGQLTYEPDVYVLNPSDEATEGPQNIQEFIEDFKRLDLLEQVKRVQTGTIYNDPNTGRMYPIFWGMTPAQLNKEINMKLPIPDCCD